MIKWKNILKTGPDVYKLAIPLEVFAVYIPMKCVSHSNCEVPPHAYSLNMRVVLGQQHGKSSKAEVGAKLGLQRIKSGFGKCSEKATQSAMH